jgi:uncharacterized protein (DUF3820 family)
MHYDPELLLILVRMRMPFGKYEGRLLCDLPVSYLEWFERKGYPKGKLGMLLQTLHVIKINGLSELLEPLKKLERDRIRKISDQDPNQNP